MPEEAYWETLFDVRLILDRLGIDSNLKDVVELGCGYGTFAIPVLRIRPRPEQIVEWAGQTGLLEAEGPPVALPPWHYGLRLRRKRPIGE